MKHLQILKIAVMYIFIMAISSCTLNLKGNYLTLAPVINSNDGTTFDARGLVDEHGIPILRVSNLYFFSESNKEFVTLTYNNNYSETLEVSRKSADQQSVQYVLGDKHSLHIEKVGQDYYATFFCNSYENTIKSGYPCTVLRYHEYVKITSIETISNNNIEGLPNSQKIAEYKKRCEIVGKVKKVTHNVYDSKQMFGEDTLVLKSQHVYTFNKDGRLLSKSYSPIYNNRKIKTLQVNYTYDKDNNLIEEIRIEEYSKEKVTSEYKDGRLVKEVYKESYDGKPYKLEWELRYKYNDSDQINEIDYYYLDYRNELTLSRKQKYEYQDNGEATMICYNEKGEVDYKNHYSIDGSLTSGFIRFGGYGIYAPDKNYTPYISATYKEIEVSRTPTTVKVSLDGSATYPEWSIANQDEEYHFDNNCNQVFLYSQLVNRTDRAPVKLSNQNIIYSYLYDDRGNWIKRRGDLYGIWGDLETECHTTVEIREIEYY